MYYINIYIYLSLSLSLFIFFFLYFFFYSNSVPPGARFDPPAPGIYPQAPGRGRGNVGGVNNPDLEFFRGPGGGGSNDFI